MKKIAIILFYSLNSYLNLAQLNQGLIADFQFDNTFLDNSSSSIILQNQGGIFAEDRFGNPNSSLYFDNNNFLTFNSSSIKVPLPVTISAWIKLTSLNDPMYLIYSDNLYENYNGYWVNILPHTGQIALNISGGLGGANGTNRRSFISYMSLELNVWYHFVGIIRSYSDMEIYIDCEKTDGFYDGTGSINMVYSNADGTIGRYIGNNLAPEEGYYFYGYMDDFKIWNRELDLNELKEICQNETNYELLAIENELELFPNPSSEGFYFNVEIDNSIEVLQVVDLRGNKIDFESEIFDGKIRLLLVNAPKGFYFATYLVDGVQLNSKLIVD